MEGEVSMQACGCLVSTRRGCVMPLASRGDGMLQAVVCGMEGEVGVQTGSGMWPLVRHMSMYQTNLLFTF